MGFKKAERKHKLLRAAFVGPSGSGKTWSALELACGIGGPVAVVDTERGSAELYADRCEFDVLVIEPPYTVNKYLDAISEAAKAGYKVLVIDQISHAWAGEGGLLDVHDARTKADPRKNSYTAWRDVTPMHNQLIEAMLGFPGHLIATMRAKVAYELVEDGKGGKRPVKLGMAPVQREGMDYEFDLVFDLSVNGHLATASKDRTSLFDDTPFVPSRDTGALLLRWLNTGSESAPPVPLAAPPEPPAKPAPKADARAEADQTVTRWLREDHDADPEKISHQLTDILGREVLVTGEVMETIQALPRKELGAVYLALGGNNRAKLEQEAK